MKDPRHINSSQFHARRAAPDPEDIYDVIHHNSHDEFDGDEWACDHTIDDDTLVDLSDVIDLVPHAADDVILVDDGASEWSVVTSAETDWVDVAMLATGTASWESSNDAAIARMLQDLEWDAVCRASAWQRTWDAAAQAGSVHALPLDADAPASCAVTASRPTEPHVPRAVTQRLVETCGTCVCCYAAVALVAFEPCGHVATCAACTLTLQQNESHCRAYCVICRTQGKPTSLLRLDRSDAPHEAHAAEAAPFVTLCTSGAVHAANTDEHADETLVRKLSAELRLADAERLNKLALKRFKRQLRAMERQRHGVWSPRREAPPFYARDVPSTSTRPWMWYHSDGGRAKRFGTGHHQRWVGRHEIRLYWRSRLSSAAERGPSHEHVDAVTRDYTQRAKVPPAIFHAVHDAGQTDRYYFQTRATAVQRGAAAAAAAPVRRRDETPGIWRGELRVAAAGQRQLLLTKRRELTALRAAAAQRARAARARVAHAVDAAAALADVVGRACRCCGRADACMLSLGCGCVRTCRACWLATAHERRASPSCAECGAADAGPAVELFRVCC